MFLKHNYDTVASFYDGLARLVFGDSQVSAQRYLISSIPPDAHILIVGGGTGWILEEIANVHPSGLTITYIELSEKMLGRSRMRACGNNDVTFISGDAAGFIYKEQFDVVLTPFLFDNFNLVHAERMFAALDVTLRAGGYWLYCDFTDKAKKRHRLLLSAMYLFFRMCCGISATQLPDMRSMFQGKYIAESESFFMDNFIGSVVYKKAE